MERTEQVVGQTCQGLQLQVQELGCPGAAAFPFSKTFKHPVITEILDSGLSALLFEISMLAIDLANEIPYCNISGTSLDARPRKQPPSFLAEAEAHDRSSDTHVVWNEGGDICTRDSDTSEHAEHSTLGRAEQEELGPHQNSQETSQLTAASSAGAAGKCVVSVFQKSYLEVDYTYEAVTMECSFSASGCPSEQPISLWFRYGANQPENLRSEGPRSEADKFQVKEALAQHHVSLTVNRVARNDSAIYICGIAFPGSSDSSAKQTGAGTTLVVRETKVLSEKTQSFLAAVLSLLSVYIIGVAVVFIVLSKSKSNSLRKKKIEDSQKKKSARRIFQEIAQELYNKRHVERNQQP
ncbi:Immunoglobulin superfamily member 6, partial [Galemys pyrenaicus]